MKKILFMCAFLACVTNAYAYINSIDIVSETPCMKIDKNGLNFVTFTLNVDDCGGGGGGSVNSVVLNSGNGITATKSGTTSNIIYDLAITPSQIDATKLMNISDYAVNYGGTQVKSLKAGSNTAMSIDVNGVLTVSSSGGSGGSDVFYDGNVVNNIAQGANTKMDYNSSTKTLTISAESGSSVAGVNSISVLGGSAINVDNNGTATNPKFVVSVIESKITALNNVITNYAGLNTRITTLESQVVVLNQQVSSLVTNNVTPTLFSMTTKYNTYYTNRQASYIITYQPLNQNDNITNIANSSASTYMRFDSTYTSCAKIYESGYFKLDVQVFASGGANGFSLNSQYAMASSAMVNGIALTNENKKVYGIIGYSVTNYQPATDAGTGNLFTQVLSLKSGDLVCPAVGFENNPAQNGIFINHTMSLQYLGK